MDNLLFGCAKSLKDLVNQSFKFKRYHEFGTIPSVFFGVLLSPIAIIGAILSLFFAIIYSFFKIISSPVEYLTMILRSEGKDVQHATQFIIYLIGFPTVFFLNIMISFFSVLEISLYFLISLCCQIFTLGGVEFHPFVNLGDSIERNEVPDLKNPSLNSNFKMAYLGLLVLIGIILEIVNHYSPFNGDGSSFVLCYLIGVVLMPFDLFKNYEHKDRPEIIKVEATKKDENENPIKTNAQNHIVNKVVNEKPIKIKEQNHIVNNGDSNIIINRICLIGLILTILTSIACFIGLIVARNTYLYRSDAYNLTINFAITNTVILSIFIVLFIIFYAKNKSLNDSNKSKTLKISIIGIIFSFIISIGGFISGNMEFYPHLSSNDNHAYYGFYYVQHDGYDYTVSIDDKISITVTDRINSNTIEMTYYYGDAKYSYAVCGINNPCLIVENTDKNLYDFNTNKLLLSKGEHVIFRIDDHSITISPNKWNFSLPKVI